MSDLGTQAEWFFIGAAEEAATQTLSVDVTTSNSATQTDLELAEEVAASALDTATRLDAGRALFWMGLGFTFLAGAWLMYPKKDAGQNSPLPEETKTEGTKAEETKVEGTKVEGMCPAKIEEPVQQQLQQPPMTRKDWVGAVPTLPNLEPFVATKPPQLSQLQTPGPAPPPASENFQRDWAPEAKDPDMADPADALTEDTVNRKMALVFAASALLLFTGFKLTRSLGKRANLDMFQEATKAASVRPGGPGYVKPDVQTKPQVEPMPPKSKPKEPSPVVYFNSGLQQGRGFKERLPEDYCDANMEILQKQKLPRNSTTAEVRVANGVVRPVPPTSCHIFRILPKQ
mmetsp:Transcript_40848/g.64346  ORF Transcript_40848/g.64346 Transcript_40848/m.64346 type:complete len:344 (+) Transcript_40848:45-1076(+)